MFFSKILYLCKVVENGVQISSSNSKTLERQAFTRGNMFSGNTMKNNGSFRLDHNLTPDNYTLPSAYDKIRSETNVEEFHRAFKNNFIYNKK